MEPTQIEPFGILILEPVTSLTDFITSVVCYFSFYLLNRQNRTDMIHLFFKLYFLSMGIATSLAAFIGHAFLYLFSFDWKMIGWIFSAIAILMLQLSSIRLISPFFNKHIIIWILRLVFLQIALFLISLYFPETRGFNMVKINSTIGLIGIVLPIHIYAWLQFKSQGSKWIAVAILWALIPGIVYNTEFTLHTWFNYHDLSHVLMSIFIIIMYFGASRIPALDQIVNTNRRKEVG